MGWINKILGKARRQSNLVLCTAATAKFFAGMGMGILLVNYLQGYNWEFYGWLSIAVALILAAPVVYIILIKK